MGWDELSKNWGNYKGVVAEKWNFLSEKDLEEIGGDRGRLIGKIEERYGLPRSTAESWVDEYLGKALSKAA